MKKNTRKNNTVKTAAVNEVGNTAPVQDVAPVEQTVAETVNTQKVQKTAPVEQTVAETVNTPEVQTPAAEKATQDQLKLIGRAVKANKISRFTKEDWSELTKDTAAKIIDENHLTEEQTPAETPVQEAAKTVTIKDPDAKATRAQLQLIGHAVKQNKIERFPEGKWNTLTKGEASEIIEKNNLAADDGTLASDEQKQKLSELVKEGFLRGFGYKYFKTITKKVASQFIRWGLYRKDNGIKAERRQTAAPAAMTPALATAGAAPAIADDIDYNDIPF